MKGSQKKLAGVKNFHNLESGGSRQGRLRNLLRYLVGGYAGSRCLSCFGLS